MTILNPDDPTQAFFVNDVTYQQPVPLATSIKDLRDVISKLRLFEGATSRINELEARIRDLEQTNRELRIRTRDAERALETAIDTGRVK